MRWWIKARRAHLALPAGLAALALLVALFRDHLAGMPSLAGGGEVMLMMFAPLPVCTALMFSLTSRLPDAEVSGQRPVAAMDLALSVATVGVVAGIGYGAGALLDSQAAASVGRNTAFLVGLMLLARPVLRSRAGIVPAGWVILVVLGGYTPLREPKFWAVLPYPGNHVPALLATAGILCAGLAASAWHQTRDTETAEE